MRSTGPKRVSGISRKRSCLNEEAYPPPAREGTFCDDKVLIESAGLELKDH